MRNPQDRQDRLTRLRGLLILSISVFVLMKRAERARVRASGSTATSAPAWRLRLEKSPPGYKKFNGNPEAVSCQQRRPIASPGGSQKGNAGCFQARWLGRWKVI